MSALYLICGTVLPRNNATSTQRDIQINAMASWTPIFFARFDYKKGSRCRLLAIQQTRKTARLTDTSLGGGAEGEGFRPLLCSVTINLGRWRPGLMSWGTTHHALESVAMGIELGTFSLLRSAPSTRPRHFHPQHKKGQEQINRG